MKKNIFTIILIICITMLHAQSNFDIPVITSRIVDAEPIVLKRLNISVFVVENIATTTLEMLFFNSNNQIMEGEFNFPLPEGVAVSRFALDVDGEMREGVVVEKSKATQAYEAITRRNVDPGIVEVSQGNNFKARVYPIPAKGYKKAIIAFEHELQDNEKEYLYQLPLNLKNKLEQFSTKVEVVLNKPKALKSDNTLINLDFTNVRNSYISKYKAEDIVLDTRLAFLVPKSQKTKTVLTYKGKQSPDNYFYFNFTPKAEERVKAKPNKIAVVWDESASGLNRDIEKDIEILQNYISWIGNAQLELITFSNTVHSISNFNAKNGLCEGIINQLANRNYDGATNIGTIDFEKIDVDEIVIFSDGISNFGSFQSFNTKAKIIAINSANIADHNFLNKLAVESNGLYINTTSLQNNEIQRLLTTKQKQFISAEYDFNNIKEVYPKYGQIVKKDFSFAGKAEGAKNKIVLNFGYANEITESKTIIVDNSQRIDQSIGERIWAQKKLKYLLVNGEEEEEVSAHGKKYQLVTPQTSLIILDEVNDYMQYDIIPPASLLKEFNQLKAQKAKNTEQSYSAKIDRICRDFKSDIKWWESAKDYRNKPKLSNKKEKSQIIFEDEEMEEVVTVAYSMVEPPSVTEHLNIVENDIELLDNLDVVKSDKGHSSYSSSLNISKWESNAEYMSDIKAVDPVDLYEKYLELKPANRKNPSFYFDVATYMFQKKQREDGLRVISNLAELELENAELLRSLGRILSENEFYEEAIYIFKRVLKLRPFEPHSVIDLGLTYNEMEEYQQAIVYLYKVIDTNWNFDVNSRFPSIELITLHDINNIIYHRKDSLDYSFINECFIKNMPLDIRIVIDWDANETDIDLHTNDPWEEKCSYQNKETTIGGIISNDITQGYGPEEFRLKHAIEGKYEIKVHFYGSQKQSSIGNVTVRAYVYTNFGNEKEEKQTLTLQLEPDKKGMYSIGNIEFKK